MTTAASAQALWSPSKEDIELANLSTFAKGLESTHNISFKSDFRALHQWSIQNPDAFWTECLTAFGLVYDGDINPARITTDQAPFARWFPQLNLNYAENMLRWPGHWTALIEAGEEGEGRHWSFSELRCRVSQHQRALRELGVSAGDCVAGVLPNIGEAVAIMLAAASIGASWASVSPDFGIAAALDRLGQVQPSVLYSVAEYRFNGKTYNVANNISKIAADLPSLKRFVKIGGGWPEDSAGIALEDALPADNTQQPDFVRLPFHHPLFVLFTSGTTGAPKCIVHGHGGTLIQLTKEHQLHCDISAQQRVIFPSTLGWMMWNWSITALASGATVILYDGSVIAPDELSIFRLSEQLRVNTLGLPSAFIERCGQKQIDVKAQVPLKDLKLIFAGGSVLSPEGFEYVYEHISPKVHLTTGSGGTDIVSCFMLGNKWQSVYAGEMQGPALGMDVQIFNEDGKQVIGERGELVCCAPAPSMPVRFANDPGNKRFTKSYFAGFPDVWTHGDFAEETINGGFVIHGRSDSVLNPGGVRIGTAEIYRQVQKIESIENCVVAGQQYDNDVRVVLFVVLAEGQNLSDELCAEIRQLLRENASPRHVPKFIIAVNDIPKTRSGKNAETAVSALINGREPSQVHALANPESLDNFRNRPELAK
ncbi:MAG: acetoacetate--CoA ligase [Gammaproteobacteria bacterium]|jgi:acetoacetyl-CoA synthetase|nr:acetoacetate--CoA ligase [Zhongshania sp.]MBU0537849.1 acetoacetate--CoA ligase [Gammaproteobacteria bacterium]MBU1832804.1 acetoacetate--CoA ligase [Gammaproteobacteria bacterium]